MSADTLPLDTPKFTEAYEIWVIRLRRDYLVRQSAVLRTNGNGCLFWPTIRASDGQHGGPNQRDSAGKPALPAAVNWRTPNGSDGEGGIMENLPGKDGHYKLRDQVNWPTPQHSEYKGMSQRGLHKPGDRLSNMVGLLAPASPSTNGKSRELWATPRNITGEKPKEGYRQRPSGNPVQKDLRTEAGKGKLNPDWVEPLMGLTVGWTDCDYSAMESSPNRQKKHSDI